MSTTATRPAYKNPYLSYTRLSRFDQCPRSYKLHYLDGIRTPSSTPAKFGKAIHAVLEVLVGEHMLGERDEPLTQARAIELYSQAWTGEGLSGPELFREGVDILESFVIDQGRLNHRDVLAVEKEFNIPVGDFTVKGFIDRIDFIDDTSIEIIDYKTNWQLFNRDELDSTLQLSLYQLAAQQLWPWVENVRLTMHMLRHGLRQHTRRSPEQLEAAELYVQTVGWQIEKATKYPPRLNQYCAYCDYRQGCPAYADALAGKVGEHVALSDIEAVAKEREQIAKTVKVLYARKGELEQVIKTYLQDKDSADIAGTRYRMLKTESKRYPLSATVRKLSEATGMDIETLSAELGTVDNKALDKLLKQHAKQAGSAQAKLLKVELDCLADITVSPRLWAKEVQS